MARRAACRAWLGKLPKPARALQQPAWTEKETRFLKRFKQSMRRQLTCHGVDRQRRCYVCVEVVFWEDVVLDGWGMQLKIQGRSSVARYTVQQDKENVRNCLQSRPVTHLRAC